MKKIRVGEIEVAYEDEGEGPGPPLLMIHGFTGHRDDFREVRGRLARARRVLIPDLRGHGDSTSTGIAEGYDFETLVRDIEGFVQAVGVHRLHLFGHSMGGMVAVRYALAHPERVASCLFVCTSPAVPVGLGRDSVLRAGRLGCERGMAWLQARIEKKAREAQGETPFYHGEYPSERYWTHHRRRLLAMDPLAYLNLGRAMMDQAPVTDRLGEIRVPCLVLVGGDDEEFLEGADLFERGLPEVVRVTLEGAAHHPHHERPEGFFAALEAHFARLGEEPCGDG